MEVQAFRLLKCRPSWYTVTGLGTWEDTPHATPGATCKSLVDGEYTALIFFFFFYLHHLFIKEAAHCPLRSHSPVILTGSVAIRKDTQAALVTDFFLNIG